jgi:OOP family OmpA-OmpF porin
VVTETAERDGGVLVRGLRDPLAADPTQLAQEAGLDLDTVGFSFQPYHAHHPEFILDRARSILSPPPSVQVEFTDGILVATGHSEREWILRARQMAPLLAGVDVYDDSRVREVDAAGAESLRVIQQLRGDIVSRVALFEVSSADMVAESQEILAVQARDVAELVRRCRQVSQEVRIHIFGHADPTGSAEFNAALSRDRAEAVRLALVAAGVPSELIVIEGRGATTSPDAAEEDEETLKGLRKVTFAVEFIDLAVEEDVNP